MKPGPKRQYERATDGTYCTGKPCKRGRCNSGIGLLGDNKEGVQRALDYLNGNL
jgi:hypothetical protein